MPNVTSVSLGRQNPSRFLPAGLIIGSGLYALLGQNGWSSLIGGALLAIWGFLRIRSAKSTYIVKTGSASDEMKALGIMFLAWIFISYDIPINNRRIKLKEPGTNPGSFNF